MKNYFNLALKLVILAICVIAIQTVISCKGHRDIELSTKEVKMLANGCEEGNYDACYCLSSHYYQDQDEKQGQYWLRKGALLGDKTAQYNMYSLLINKNDKGSTEEAISFLKKSAEQNKTAALLAMGGLYQEGLAVGKDANKAILWYKRAASLGNRTGMQQLSRIYTEIAISYEDLSEAYIWAEILYLKSKEGTTYANYARSQQAKINEKAHKLSIDFELFRLSAEKKGMERSKIIPPEGDIVEPLNCKAVVSKVKGGLIKGTVLFN